MAEETKTVKKPKPEPKFVTEARFGELENQVGTLIGLVKQSLTENAEAKTKDPVAVAAEKEITKAGPKQYITPVNPEWEELARGIIGTEKVDRCEMEHGRTGGLIFTIVIKKEYSNAPDAYLAVYKEDRRSREIGNEGIGGVEAWAKLIAQNLKRGKSYESK